MKKYIVLLCLVVSWFLLCSRPATAVEPICPGGSSPRADIIWCADFDTTTDCVIGNEDPCWFNNGGYHGIGSGTQMLIIQGQGGSAVGTGFVRIDPEKGSTGFPTANKEPITTFPGVTAVNYRYYIKYSKGYLSFFGGHGPQIIFDVPDHSCGAAMKFQMSTYTGQLHYDGIGSCGGGLDSSGSAVLPELAPNQGNWTGFLNNRWYALEIRVQMDTVCSNHTGLPWTGCNGIVQAWVDGTLTHSYSGLNLGGEWTATNKGGMVSAYKALLPSGYYHFSFPAWGSEIAFDNIVFSNNATFIGCANDPTRPNFISQTACPGNAENARGTGDTSSPYMNFGPYINWWGHQAHGDCTSSSYLGVYSWGQYRSGATIDAGHTHGLYTSGCTNLLASFLTTNHAISPNPRGSIGMLYGITDGNSPTDCSVGGGGFAHNCQCDQVTDLGGSTFYCSHYSFTSDTERALHVHLANNSDGGGTAKEGGNSSLGEGSTIPWHQLVTYGWVYIPSGQSFTSLTLSGFANNILQPAGNAWVGLAVSSGKWAINQNNFGVRTTITSNTNVTFDGWHEYELTVHDDNTVNLMIDRTMVITRQASQSVAWAFVVAQPTAIVGVTDYTGTAPLDVWFDDSSAGSVSFWSCDNWGAASCPFASGPPPTPPAAPTNLHFLP